MSEEVSIKLKEYKDKGISRIKVGITDIDGVIRGKYISLKKFESILNSTGGFCDCVFGWDVADSLYDNGVAFTGWHTAYPDALFKIDISTERWLEEERTPYFIADFVANDGESSHDICPRNLLKKVLKRAESMGLLNMNFLFFKKLLIV